MPMEIEERIGRKKNENKTVEYESTLKISNLKFRMKRKMRNYYKIIKI